MLVTDDPASTVYLTAWSPAGRRWFLAVTGTDAGRPARALDQVQPAADLRVGQPGAE
jgi:hypothetical protein